VNGIIDSNQLATKIDGLDVPASYKDILINEARITLQQRMSMKCFIIN
ncbi:unnamed protein product, partial [marine sediment metagenome]